MKLLYKILISFILITLVINSIVYFSFFLTFEKTNEQDLEIYTLSKKLFQINLIIEKNSELKNLVNDYSKGKINSVQLTNKANDLKKTVEDYRLIHVDSEDEDSSLYNTAEIMERDVKNIIRLKGEYNTLKLNLAISDFQESSEKYEKELRQHYREYEQATEKYHKEFNDSYSKGLNLILISSLILILFIIILGVFITYQIINPIHHIIEISKKVSRGEEAKANIQSDDEFGDMGFAFNMMIDKIYNKNKELEVKINELEKFTKLVVDREIKMLELKRKIEESEKK